MVSSGACPDAGFWKKEEQEALDALDRKLTDGAFQLNLF